MLQITVGFKEQLRSLDVRGDGVCLRDELVLPTAATVIPYLVVCVCVCVNGSVASPYCAKAPPHPHWPLAMGLLDDLV